MGELRSHFRPEFLNRIDEIILFKPLTLPEIEQIVDLMFNDLRSRLGDRRIPGKNVVERYLEHARRSSTDR